MDFFPFALFFRLKTFYTDLSDNIIKLNIFCVTTFSIGHIPFHSSHVLKPGGFAVTLCPTTTTWPPPLKKTEAMA